MKAVSTISMAVFLLASPFLAYGFGVELWRIAGTIGLADPRWRAFAIGAAVFVPFLFIARRLFGSLWSWIETFEHELTHLVVGLFFLKIPVSFRVSAHSGGEVKHIGRGSTGQTWITLAPYFLPTASIVVVIVASIFGIASNYALAALGWTTAFHLVTSWAETSFRQPDLKKAGIVKTLLILPLMNIICYGAVLAFVAGGGKGFANFWKQGVGGAARIGSAILDFRRS